MTNNETLLSLLTRMQRSLPFTGDRAYIRNIIDMFIENEVKPNIQNELKDVKNQLRHLSLKMGMQPKS